MFSVSLVIGPGATLQIGGNSVEEMAQSFVDLGGDPARLKEDVERAVADYMEGALQPAEVKVFSLNGDLDQAEAAVRSGMQDRDIQEEEDLTDTSVEEPESDSEPEVVNDPWGVPDSGRKAAASSSGPRRATSGQGAAQARRESQPSGPRGTGVHKQKDKFNREWTTGLPNSPECFCGEAAARVVAPQRRDPNKKYTKWKCAKSAPGGDWREKCEFDKFPNELD